MSKFILETSYTIVDTSGNMDPITLKPDTDTGVDAVLEMTPGEYLCPERLRLLAQACYNMADQLDNSPEPEKTPSGFLA